ncbi:hypothetical protein SprV_0501774600 [Sparganum proliferum]
MRIAYRTDGHLSSGHMQLSTTTAPGLFFADDCALNITTEEETQRSIDLFVSGCVNFRLAISKDRTVFMHQPLGDMEHKNLRISVYDSQLKTLDNFAYLESIPSLSTKIDSEVARRISKASQAFSRLQSSL